MATTRTIRHGTAPWIAVTGLVVALVFGATAHGAVKSNGKTIAVQVNCTGTPSTTQPPDSIYGHPTVIPGSGCSGSFTVTARTRKKTITVGSAGFSLNGGQNAAVDVKMSRKARKALFFLGRLKAKVTASTDSVVTIQPKLTIKPLLTPVR
jgi:hypothetical protein